ncbi:MAG: MBL fold metallo-hydrolase [Candidatus Thorarchaeota archaeon]
MALARIIDGIYACTDGTNGGNHGAIVLDDEVVMIDAGMIHPKSRITKEFLEKETGLPILKLVLTHHHSDHVFGVQSFEPVTLIASESTRRSCEENLRNDWKIENLKKNYEPFKDERAELWESLNDLTIRLPDVVFQNQLTLGNNDELTIKLLGGHTEGSTIVISHLHDTIFIGDLVFNGTFPYGGDRTCNPDRWISGLEEVLSLGLDTIIPGHGPVCGLIDVEEYIQGLSDLRANVKEALNSGISVDEFLDSDRIPSQIASGSERFGLWTLEHWYRFYG